MKKASGLIKVCGRVKSVHDEDGDDIFQIVTAESEHFSVDPNRAGADLQDYEGQWVEASGVTRREAGSTHIVVHSFYVVNENCWTDEDDEDW